MSVIKRIYCFVSKNTVGLFYDNKYLTGRWFDDSTKGWRWCWRNFFMQKIVGYNKKVPFPVSHRNNVGSAKNISFHNDDLNNFQNFGCYYQAFEGNISIGRGTWIAPNVGLITENHNIYNLNEHMQAKDIHIGCECWIGMNSIILPGIVLGDHTIVGAGAVVTKSYLNGHCVLVGNPARCIKELEKDEFYKKI